MPRVFRALCALASVSSVVGVTAASAQAKPIHITGKQTTITPSSQVTQFLTKNGIGAAAVGPATLSGGTLTLPIVGGRASASGARGVVRHAGGLKFSKGSRHVVLRHFVLFGNINHPRLAAAVRGHRFVFARMLTDTHSASGNTVTLKGELTLTPAGARIINHRLHKHVAKAGLDLGSLTSTITAG
jgi:hypothetical protein